MKKLPTLTVKTTVPLPVDKAWEYWTLPKHIVQWNFASDDWSCPKATNDLREGGKFTSRMEAKDGSMGFDFEGVYETVELHKRLSYRIADGRRVDITFAEENGGTTITETFEAESTNSLEMQQNGWQAIMDNFRKYVESN